MRSDTWPLPQLITLQVQRKVTAARMARAKEQARSGQGNVSSIAPHQQHGRKHYTSYEDQQALTLSTVTTPADKTILPRGAIPPSGTVTWNCNPLRQRVGQSNGGEETTETHVSSPRQEQPPDEELRPIVARVRRHRARYGADGAPPSPEGGDTERTALPPRRRSTRIRKDIAVRARAVRPRGRRAIPNSRRRGRRRGNGRGR